MDTLIDDIRRIASELNLTETEKFEVYKNAVDQIYRASHVLSGQPEEWTAEEIAEAFQKTGALPLTELAKRVKAKSNEFLSFLTSRLVETEAHLFEVASDFDREWPPVPEESKLEVRRNLRFVDTCKSEITNAEFINELLLNLSVFQQYEQMLESTDKSIANISKHDQSYKNHLYQKERAAQQHISQLVDLISAQKKLTRQERRVLENKGASILEQIKRGYRSGQFSSKEVLDAFDVLTTAGTFIDTDPTGSVHDIKLIDERILLRLFDKK